MLAKRNSNTFVTDQEATGIGPVTLNNKIIPSPLNVRLFDSGRRARIAKYDKSIAQETAAQI